MDGPATFLDGRVVLHAGDCLDVVGEGRRRDKGAREGGVRSLGDETACGGGAGGGGDDYDRFVRAKIRLARSHGDAVTAGAVHPLLKPHQADAVRWLVAGGRRALFAAFGLGKTFIQIEAVRLTLEQTGGRGLIVLPLGVRQEFVRDAAKLGVEVRFIRAIEDAAETGIYLTNYETVRDGKLDPARFQVASLDEASCLRGFGGTKTFREFMRLFEAVPRRFVATATPSPNDTIEILAYSAFLGVMDVGEAKTRFFKRNSEKADQLTLHPHKAREFWLWVASWALFVQRPSDLGHDDTGYDLPPLRVHWHEVSTTPRPAPVDRGGQASLFADPAVGVVEAARVRRETMSARVARAVEIVAAEPGRPAILWHDLEDERRAIEGSLPGVVSVWGSQDLDDRERSIIGFSDGAFPFLSTKPVIAGSGCNFQRHCSKAVFVGVGFKFNDFIQAIHRIYRFLQSEAVDVHIVHADGDREIVRALQRKWRQHEEMVSEMTAIIREYGLSTEAMAAALSRSLGRERVEVSGEGYRLVNDDTVRETRRMPADSVGLIVTSIPFSTQYEYTPDYHDFGHTDDDGHFWQQMDFLVPELLRVLRPGRLAAVHVKDRIVPGGVSGLGFQTLSTFHCDCIAAFRRHGFAYLGMKTITTDVVRENNQTYRLGWSEQCKDGSRMGFGVPEYLLLFRKPPTDRSNGYADEPVTKAKKWRVDAVSERVETNEDGSLFVVPATEAHWLNPDGYSRARWQLDAHAYTRSDGVRQAVPEDWAGLPADQVWKLWKRFSLDEVVAFDRHVRIAEAFEERGSLPSTFMLLPPHAPHPDVWTDITRMLGMNTLQSAKGAENHLCPLQFDIVDRAIRQWSNPGDVVFDPFGGLMTVPYRAVKLGRVGWANELNPRYFLDGSAYVEAAARGHAMPTLFDVIGAEAAGEAAE